MKVWQFEPGPGSAALQLVEHERPVPGPGQVLIQVRAAALNYRDLYIRAGVAAAPEEGPVVLLSDGAGTVVALGPGVARVRSGDNVMLTFLPDWLAGPPSEEQLAVARGSAALPGMLREYVVASESEVLPLPGHLVFTEGATLPCAALTAWTVLHEGGLRADETVLLLGTGGVSICGLQFAKAFGARVIMVSRSAAKLMRARELGADQTIDATQLPNWENEVRKLTDGRGVDHVLEVVGAATLHQSLASVRLGGRVYLIGALGGDDRPLDLRLVRENLAILQGAALGSRATFEAMNRFIAAHQLRPVIDRTFTFAEAPAAFEYLASGAQFGKIVIAW